MSSWAQWQWVDDTGRKVFSDRAPPPHIAPERIVRKPAGAPMPAATPPSNNATAAADGVDPALQKAAAQRQAAQAREEAEREQQAAAQKAKEEAQLAQQRKDNCQRAKQAKATLESSMRVMRVNEKGERGYMSEAQRAKQLKEADKFIRSSC